MASLVIPSGLTYVQKDLLRQFFTPLFIDNPILNEHFTLIPDVKTSRELLMISPLDKITKGYQRGTSFTSSTGVVITPKTLTVARMKAQVEQTPDEFWQSVYQILVDSGVDANDVENSPELKSIIIKAYTDAMTRDAIRQGWLGDTTLETMTATGSLYSPSGTLNEHYKEYTGIIPRIKEMVRTGEIAAAQVVDINTSTYQNVVAVKAKKTATLTGTSGTANVTINGVEYLATFASDLTTTAANFVTAYAATILARHGRCVVTSSGADIIVEAGVPGMNVLVTVSAAVSGNLTGSVAATTAAVRNTTLKAGAAVAILQALYEARTDELAEFDATEARFDVTRSVYENYLAYLQTQSGAEAAFSTLVNGVRTLTFNGIPVMKRPDWDKRWKSADFGYVQPHFALLSTHKNYVWGTDSTDDMAQVEAWYEKKDQMNYFRTQYCAGTQIVHPVYVTVAL